MEFDAIGVRVKPSLAVFIQAMPRPVVDDEKDLLARVAANELLEESQEAVAVEHLFETVREVRVVQRDRSEDVRRSTPAEGIYARLVPDS